MNIGAHRRKLLVLAAAGALTLSSASMAAAVTFSSTGNADPIIIGAGGLDGPAAPFPSTITVSGLPITADLTSVVINGFTHQYAADVDIMLRSPQGQQVILMSDIPAPGGCGVDVNNATFTFRDGSPSMTSAVSGTYSPTDINPGCVGFPNTESLAGADSLATFNSGNPNGTWQLFVMDDSFNDAGSIASWSLVFPDPVGTFSVNPTSRNYGDVRVGNSSFQTFTVTNTGQGPLSITNAALGGANPSQFNEFSDLCTGVTLAPFQSCQVTVRFVPTSTGAKSAILTFTHNAAGSPHNVPLSGTGVAPTFTVSPTSADFGSERIGESSAAETFTVTNTGTASLTITDAALAGADADDFEEVTDNCTGATLAAGGGTCTVSARFRPNSIGTHDAVLRFTSNAASSPDDVALRGTGRAGPGPDGDLDGVADATDNCPTVQNPNQADADGDGIGNVCENPPHRDDDNDGIFTPADNCPGIANPGQRDSDGDGVGDACERATGGGGGGGQPGTDTRKRIDPSIKGKNTRTGDNRIIVRAKAANGAHVTVYGWSFGARERRVQVDEGFLNANGVFKTVINDKNRRRITVYKAVVSPTGDTLRGVTDRLQQR